MANWFNREYDHSKQLLLVNSQFIYIYILINWIKISLNVNKNNTVHTYNTEFSNQLTNPLVLDFIKYFFKNLRQYYGQKDEYGIDLFNVENSSVLDR